MGTEVFVLENTLKYLRFFLLWPKKGTELNPGKIFYFKFILLTLSTTFLLYGSVAHMVVSLYEKKGVDVDLDISVIISLVGTYYFNFSYLSSVETLAGIYKDFSKADRFELPPGYPAFIKKWNRFSVLHFIYYILMAFNSFLAPFLENKKCLETNKNKNLQEVCGLATNVWLPFRFDYFPVKQIIYGAQIYSAFFSYVASSTVSFSIMESNEHVIFRLEYVRRMFVEALKREGHESVEIFVHAVRYHNFVIGLAKRLNKCFSPCIFVHVLFTGAILGCIGFQSLKGPHYVTIVILVGWYLSLLMVAAGGQRLIDTATSIGNAIYNVDWHRKENEVQKNVVMVLVRCQRPIYLQAGPFGFMSYQMIVTIMKTAYSIVSVMKATSSHH